MMVIKAGCGVIENKNKNDQSIFGSMHCEAVGCWLLSLEQ